MTGQVERLLRIHLGKQLPQRIFPHGHCHTRVRLCHVLVQQLQRLGAFLAVCAVEKNTLACLRIDSRVSVTGRALSSNPVLWFTCLLPTLYFLPSSLPHFRPSFSFSFLF